MADFVNRVIRSGFALGRRSSTDEPEKHGFFPTLSRSSLGNQIIDRNAFCLPRDIEDFKGDLLFLSLRASTIKKQSYFGFCDHEIIDAITRFSLSIVRFYHRVQLFNA
jgi:hypothetical protein